MTSSNPMSNFILTPQQQSLLFAALNSNRPTNAPSNAMSSLSPASLNSFQNSPEIDYEYDFNGPDSSFDFSFDNTNPAKMIGDLPGSSIGGRSDSGEAESPDKRSHPDDEETHSPKRRESEDKVAKKPGRKPLTTEPSSKRKAQNRAAQRAFRERKEKHLKDLETKVQELEAASQAANHENKLLRAQVDKMTVELNEYKKRVSVMSKDSRSSRPAPIWGAPLTSGIGDVNFHFEFPKFGQLSGVSSSTQSKKASPSPAAGPGESSAAQSKSPNAASPGQDSRANKEDLSDLTNGLFSPPLTNQNVAKASRHGSSDSHFSTGGAASTSSPSASSNSNMGGPSSSCGTSPEPFTQSPMGFKPVDTLTTIGEEQLGVDGSTDFDQFANIDLPDFNWLPQNFQFDPQLFGDYREPQDNILSNGLDDTFFNDAFDMDFTTPYNLPVTAPAAPKKDLIAEIDAAKEQDEAPGSAQLLTCNKIWETLQNCPKVQSGDFDLDGLCSDLQKKAKCSGTGAVVDEQDFKAVMKKYLGEHKTEEEFKRCTGEIKS